MVSFALYALAWEELTHIIGLLMIGLAWVVFVGSWIFYYRGCAVPLGKTLMVVRKGRRHWSINLRILAFVRVARHHTAVPLLLQMCKWWKTFSELNTWHGLRKPDYPFKHGGSATIFCLVWRRKDGTLNR